jgi:hypothetical protein
MQQETGALAFRQPMTYFEAALTVLRRARRPLTTREIVVLAIKGRLIEPEGKTPEATMSAELYQRVGSDERLVKLGVPGASARNVEAFAGLFGE